MELSDANPSRYTSRCVRCVSDRFSARKHPGAACELVGFCSRRPELAQLVLFAAHGCRCGARLKGQQQQCAPSSRSRPADPTLVVAPTFFILSPFPSAKPQPHLKSSSVKQPPRLPRPVLSLPSPSTLLHCVSHRGASASSPSPVSCFSPRLVPE
jgi:hypothetical protein